MDIILDGFLNSLFSVGLGSFFVPCLAWVSHLFMNMALIKHSKRGDVLTFSKGVGCLLVFSFLLLSGCVTSSPEDDYVSGILADAMQDSIPAGEMPVLVEASQPVAPVSVKPPPSVSIPAPMAVSVSPGGTVSVSPVTSVVKPVSVKPPPSVLISAPTTVTVTPDGVVSVSQTSLPSSSRPPPVVIQEVVEASSDSAVSLAVTNGSVKLPAPRAATPTIPTIQPDSILWVSVSEDPSLNGRYVVSDASAIDFGYVGMVFLPDMSIQQAEAELKRVLEGRYLKNATVSVKLAKASYDRIGVQGNVQMPGDIKIGPGSTISLSEALRRAGGLRGNRENSRVKVIRGGVKSPFGPAAEGDVYSLMTEAGQLKVPDVFLRNDDLAYVFTPAMDTSGGQSPTAGVGNKRVVVLGEVPRRGVVEFAENEPCTLMYLLFKIGGLPRFARADKISIVRRNKDGSEKTFIVNGELLMKNGTPEDDMILETGDRIVVPTRSISFL